MFKGMKAKLDDMATIKRLCETAEACALHDQQREPGAEHFLLAALDLPDGTARLAFERVGVAPDALKPAIGRQYDEALRALGIQSVPPIDTPRSPNAGLYEAAPSGAAVMQELAATRRSHGPLLGAHVVGIVAGMAHGVAPRALRALGLDPAALKSAAEAITEARRAS